jgi:hypothetical protein
MQNWALSADEQRWLDFVAEYELRNGRCTPLDEVVLEAGADEALAIAAVESLEAKGLLELTGMNRREVALKRQGALISSSAELIDRIITRLLEYFRERLAAERTNFRTYSWEAFKKRYDLADADFGQFKKTVQLFRLNNGGSSSDGPPPKADWEVPTFLVKLRTFNGASEVHKFLNARDREAAEELKRIHQRKIDVVNAHLARTGGDIKPEQRPPAESGGQGKPRRRAKPANWERVTAISAGLVFLVALLAIAAFVPNPTPFQEFVFRVVLAIAAAAFGSTIPGLLEVDIGAGGKFAIRAAGALALFVTVFLVNPTRLLDHSSETTSGSQASKSEHAAVEPVDRRTPIDTGTRSPASDGSPPIEQDAPENAQITSFARSTKPAVSPGAASQEQPAPRIARDCDGARFYTRVTHIDGRNPDNWQDPSPRSERISCQGHCTRNPRCEVRSAQGVPEFNACQNQQHCAQAPDDGVCSGRLAMRDEFSMCAGDPVLFNPP